MEYSITQLRKKLRSGTVSAEKLTQDILYKAKHNDLNCFICMLDAERQAKFIDIRAKSGFYGSLLGAPIAIKDNMRYIGSKTTCGSALLRDCATELDAEDSFVVKRLKAAGAIVLGKTNMDEFAMGSSNMTSAYGYVLNPLDKTRVPGGSSGGSAAAVAAGLCFAALGSDTGGSIRQPASYCGVVGLKPTYGSIDSAGMYSLSQDMDQIGPITRTVEENRLIFEVLSGRKIDLPAVKDIKVGLIKEFEPYYNKDTLNVIAKAKEVLGGKCEFKEYSAPSIGLSYYVYEVLGNIQATMNLRNIGTPENRGKLLGKEVIKRILIGEYAIAHPLLVMRAREIKSKIISELSEIMKECDAIISPTAPSTAFEFTADKTRKEIVFSDIFTQPASIAGLPALSVPCCVGEGGMPLGVQLIGNKGEEGLLFAMGNCFEDYNNARMR